MTKRNSISLFYDENQLPCSYKTKLSLPIILLNSISSSETVDFTVFERHSVVKACFPTQEIKKQAKKFLSKLNESWNYFVSGSSIQTAEAETARKETHNNDFAIVYGRTTIVKMAQLILRSLKKFLPTVLEKGWIFLLLPLNLQSMTQLLTATGNVVKPGVQNVVSSITGSSGHGPKNLVQNPNQRDVSRSVEYTTLKTVSSPTNLFINHSRKRESQNNKTFRDDYFPTLISKYDCNIPNFNLPLRGI